MEVAIISSLENVKADLLLKSTVHSAVQEMVGKIERHALRNNLLRVEENFLCAQKLNDSLLDYIKQLEHKNAQLIAQASTTRASASLTRDAFVSEIGYFLAESKANMKIRNRLSLLESKIAKFGYAVDESQDTEGEKEAEKEEVAEPEAAKEQAVVSKEVVHAERGRILCHLEDRMLLEVFSFLETAEVLNTAQVCRFFYKRVDSLFGTESAVVKQWSQEELSNGHSGADAEAVVPASSPAPPAAVAVEAAAPAVTAAAAGSSAGDARWTREILDSLTKKLNAQEMKVVLDVAERLKKQSTANEALTVENEDLAARLQSTESIRDFLVDKLKSAEKALKALMLENGGLRKQSSSDQEIIAYLDGHVQELDGQVLELTHRCQHMQAALDLQIGTHSHRVSSPPLSPFSSILLLD